MLTGKLQTQKLLYEIVLRFGLGQQRVVVRSETHCHTGVLCLSTFAR